jgi:hypothetical protein
MSTLVGDPLEEPMPLGAATVYLNLTLGEYLELEGAQWLYLKLFQSTIDSTTKGGRIYNVVGAAGVGVINVVIFFCSDNITSCYAIVLGEYLELEGAQWLYLKLFQSTINSTTKGGRIFVSYGASERRKWM